MSSHTVYRLTSQSSFEGIEAFQETIPVASNYEILVKIRSVALNFRDIAISKGFYPFSVKGNVVPCSDMAGEVVQVGEGVQDFHVGDRVTSTVCQAALYGPVLNPENTLGSSIDGVLRQYIVLPAHVAVRLPDSRHTFTEWAASITTSYSVWNAFYGSVPLKPGQTVLVLGTGGVSLTGLIFAKAAGATTIITSSSDQKLQTARERYGADHIINYKTHPDWAAEVKRITKGVGVDHILEVGGAGTIEQSLESIAYGGTISVIGFLSPLTGDRMPDVALTTLAKGATLRGILAASKQQLEGAIQFVGACNLPVPVDKSFAFTREDIIKALEYLEAGRHVGKVCINLD